jgi:predicted small secreted protein
MLQKISWVMLLLTAMFLQGCNTMNGFGQDLKRGGEEIQRVAQK